MDDTETLAFLRRIAGTSRYVTSVCTGSLVLGAAGLLAGYRATGHWLARDQLSLFGAEPVDERIVFDRNRVTGAGVTAGIDFALALVAHLLGDAVAKEIQLQIEYAPSPPFDTGTPDAAGPELAERLRERGKALRERRWETSRRAAAALKI
jgi:cyclohexyl-isocyanide hydratase